MQTTDETWFYAMTALIDTEDEEQVARFFGDVMAAELPSLAGRAPFVASLGEVLARWRITTPAARGAAAVASRRCRPRRCGGRPGAAGAGIRCALATNQHPERATYVRENLGYDEVFDGLFYSCELGVAKPDPAYFTEAVRRLGTEPGRTLLIDDNIDNVAAAKEAGLVADLFASDGGRGELDRILGEYVLR